MDLFQIPTDNLYIFLTLGGIAILIFSINFFYKNHLNLQREILKLDKEVAGLKIDVDSDSISSDNIHRKITIKKLQLTLKYGIKINDDENIEDTQKSLESFVENRETSDIEDFINSYSEIFDLLHEERNKKFVTQKKLENIKISYSNLEHERKQSKLLLFAFLVSTIMSLTIISSGFWMWYSKHQVYQDRLIKIKYENIK